MKDFSDWLKTWDPYGMAPGDFKVFIIIGLVCMVGIGLHGLWQLSIRNGLLWYGATLITLALIGSLLLGAASYMHLKTSSDTDDPSQSAVFIVQVEKEFDVRNLSCPPNVMSTKDELPDAGTYRCTVSDGRDDSAMKDVTLIVTADNKVGLYDNQGKEMK